MMPETDSIITIDEAFALATAEEGGVVTPPVTETAQPAATADPALADEQAPTDGSGTEQTASQSEIGSLIDLAAPTSEGPSIELGTDEFWAQTVEVAIDGVPTTMSLKEMSEGTMMRSDYTKKTQDVARDRKMAEEAVEFYDWFRKDPTQASLYLAQKAGVVGADAQSASTSFDFGTANESDLEQKVEEAVAQHPQVIQAQKDLEVGAVQTQFAAMENDYGEPITAENRLTVLKHAKEAGTTNLRMVFDALLFRGAQIRQAQAEVAATGTTQSGGTPAGGDPNAVPKIETIEDAFDFAIRSQAESVSA